MSIFHRRTKQGKALDKFSQLFLSSKEWEEPEEIVEDGLNDYPQDPNKVVGWIVKRKAK